MAERILFLTGHLARPRLEKVLARIEDAGFEWSIFDVGVKVAALMTEAIISRRLPRPVQADRIVVPGRCRADLDRLSARIRRPVRAWAGGIEGLAGLLRKARPRARSVASRHAHIRRDRRCFGAERRCHPRACHRHAGGGRRRDRSWLSAGHAVPASRRRRTRAQGCRPSGQRRLGRDRRTAPRPPRRAPLSCSASPNTRSTLRATAARRPCSFRPPTATWRRCCARPRPQTSAGFRRSSIRSSIRSISDSRPRCNATRSSARRCRRPKS